LTTWSSLPASKSRFGIFCILGILVMHWILGGTYHIK
jgi:hypothetical protein